MDSLGRAKGAADAHRIVFTGSPADTLPSPAASSSAHPATDPRGLLPPEAKALAEASDGDILHALKDQPWSSIEAALQRHPNLGHGQAGDNSLMHFAPGCVAWRPNRAEILFNLYNHMGQRGICLTLGNLNGHTPAHIVGQHFREGSYNRVCAALLTFHADALDIRDNQGVLPEPLWRREAMSCAEAVIQKVDSQRGMSTEHQVPILPSEAAPSRAEEAQRRKDDMQARLASIPTADALALPPAHCINMLPTDPLSLAPLAFESVALALFKNLHPQQYEGASFAFVEERMQSLGLARGVERFDTAKYNATADKATAEEIVAGLRDAQAGRQACGEDQALGRPSLAGDWIRQRYDASEFIKLALDVLQKEGDFHTTLAILGELIDSGESLEPERLWLLSRDSPIPAPLELALDEENYELAEFLLQRGADPNGDYRGTRRLYEAALRRRPKAIALLLAYGANPNLCNDFSIRAKEDSYWMESSQMTAGDWRAMGRSAMHIAAVRNDTALMNQLIAAGASVNAEPEWDVPPLIDAIWAGNHEGVESLLQRGANVGAVAICEPYWGTRTSSPLREAIDQGNERLVRRLLRAGADIHDGQEKGDTVLHRAVRQNSRPILEALWAYGAQDLARVQADQIAEGRSVKILTSKLLHRSHNIKSSHRTAWESATRLGLQESIDFLREKGADESGPGPDGVR